MPRTIPIETLIGQSFGRLTVLGFGGHYISPKAARERLLRCRCECGATVEIRYGKLRSGGTRSCGCLRREIGAILGKKIKHGEGRNGRTTAEYRAWSAMIRRCYYRKDKTWLRYGGRGIQVCNEWRYSYPAFLSYIGRKPGPEYSLDRYPDNNGNYEPGNVRWASLKEQHRNKRSNRKLTYGGLTLTIVEWAERVGLSANTIEKRLGKGWGIKETLTTAWIPPHLRRSSMTLGI